MYTHTHMHACAHAYDVMDFPMGPAICNQNYHVYTCVTAAGCGLVIPILTFMLTDDIHRSGYASGHYGDSVWDCYRILFYLGRACTHLTERWQALFSQYS